MAREPRELISLPDQTPAVAYAASGVSTTEFAFNFPYWKDSDIQVWTRATGVNPWTERFDFSITPTSGFAQTGYPSATITLPAVLNTEVVIARRGTFDRLSNFNPGQALDLFSLNRDMTRAVGLNQTLRMLLNTCLRSSDQPADLVTGLRLLLPVLANLVNRVLGFDGTGNVEMRSVDVNESRSLASVEYVLAKIAAAVNAAPLPASAFSVISWHGQVVEEDVTIPDNRNAWSIGPVVDVAPGVTVTIGLNSFWTIAKGDLV